MRKDRFIRMVALAGCSVLIGAFGYTPSATAHIGASHAPFNTDGPDLLSASIVGGTTVRACFDVAIDAINDDTDFDVWLYDSYDDHVFDNWAGSVINPDNDKCVDLDGSNHESLAQARTLTAGGNSNAGAVEDAAGNGNSAGAVALTGGVAASAIHETDAPELLTATRVGSTERVRFGFDENVDTGDAPDPNEFGFEDPTGEDENGQTIIAVDDNEVEVEFDGTPSVSTARQFYVNTRGSCNGDDNAVWDLGHTDQAGPNDGAKYNVLDTILTGTPSGRTDDPDVTAVAVADGNRLNYTFDERIDPGSVNQGCFYAYEADGDAHEGDDFDILSNTASGAVVQIDFLLNGESDQIQIAAADHDAVDAEDDGDSSSRGSFDLSDTLEAGFSDGPDLEQAIPNTGANRVTYCFDLDETLDAADVDDGDYQLIKRDGTGQTDYQHANGDAFLGTGPANCATIGFDDDGPDAVADSIAAHVSVFGTSHSARDLLPTADENNRASGASDGDGNEEVARATVGMGGPPPTGTPAAPAPPTPPGPTPPGVPTVRTGLCDPNRTTAPLSELVIGGNGPDLICGFGGDDTLRGLGGGDTLKGQQGADTAAGGKGKDNARGGPGKDVLRGSKGADTLKGGGGKDTARGGKGNDLCRAETEKGCES